MPLLTLYNAVAPEDVSEVEARVPELLDHLGFTVGRTATREDGSRLLDSLDAHDRPGLTVWLVPIEPGSFEASGFDDEAGAKAAAGARTLCKVGAREAEDPRVAVLAALAATAELGREGRVYDPHASMAFEPEAASRLAREPFDVGRFLTYHYLAPPTGDAHHSWLHLHGMAKFFCPDLEAFDVHPEVSHRALGLLLAVAAEMAAGLTPAGGALRSLGRGTFRLRPSEEVRAKLGHFRPEDFDDEHRGACLAVEDAGRLGSLTLLLRGAYELEPKSRAECEAEQRVWQARLESIRERWARGGEERVLLRAGLPVGEGGAVEHMWVEAVLWESRLVRAKLLNDAFADPAMSRGTEVAFEETRVSGVCLWRDAEALDEVETLRAVDPAAADLLDEALAEPEDEARVLESRSPDGRALARFLDDGRTGYLHLLGPDGAGPLAEPLWLFNRLPTPPVLDLRGLDRGRLPLLSEVYTWQRTGDEAPRVGSVEIAWSEDGALLLLDGEPWALASPGERRGWSRMIEVAGRFGRPWDEVENLVRTVRGEDPKGEPSDGPS